jgi:hypothetical protein
MVLVLLTALALLVRRGFRGIWRNNAKESMLWGVGESCKRRNVLSFSFPQNGGRGNSPNSALVLWCFGENRRTRALMDPFQVSEVFVRAISGTTRTEIA